LKDKEDPTLGAARISALLGPPIHPYKASAKGRGTEPIIFNPFGNVPALMFRYADFSDETDFAE
jgi:hypothetical protein